MHLKDITPTNVVAFIEGKTRHWLFNHYPNLVRKHLIEQVMYRMQVCSPCLLAGECNHCGCQTPHLFFATKPCSGGKYPPLMNNIDWIMFKSLEQMKAQKAQQAQQQAQQQNAVEQMLQQSKQVTEKVTADEAVLPAETTKKKGNVSN